jgi:hypothetical protein
MADEVNMNKVNVPLWTLCTLIKRHPGATRTELTRMLNFELRHGRSGDYLHFFKPSGHTLSRFTCRVRAVPPGRKREVWTYHLREAGQVVADSPKPVAFSARRKESAPRCHEADWVADAQPGEMLVYRKQYNWLFGDQLLTLVSKEAVKLVTDEYVIQRWGRPIFHGTVSVMLSNGKLQPACADHLRPALRRTRRLQLDGQ